jgi:hypothetical protein
MEMTRISPPNDDNAPFNSEESPANLAPSAGVKGFQNDGWCVWRTRNETFNGRHLVVLPITGFVHTVIDES